MPQHNVKREWEDYCKRELAAVSSILKKHGYELDNIQPHLLGERFLMNAVTTTSGRKLILLGRHKDGRVVIKATRERSGIREIDHERTCRNILAKIDFARDVFHTPREVAYIHENDYVICIQEFIDQTSAFLERPLEEQFHFALSAFRGQEGAHATTYKHRALIAGTFGIRDARTYLKNFSSFKDNLLHTIPEKTTVHERMAAALATLTTHTTTIDQYCGFLTHTDFVPHNIRIMDNTIYLLDHSSLTFGNKYEGWARFLNFMTLYNPPLERALVEYVRNNRTEEESVSLWLMRIYRLGEILWYYAQTLAKSSEDLLALNTSRIHFWNDVLAAVLERKEVDDSVRETYIKTRDALRSEDEKRRQQGLH